GRRAPRFRAGRRRRGRGHERRRPERLGVAAASPAHRGRRARRRVARPRAARGVEPRARARPRRGRPHPPRRDRAADRGVRRVDPWRRRVDDPWYDWARFSAGVSLAYGTLLETQTLALEGDAQFQWRRFTATAEYEGEHASPPLSAGQTSKLHWPRQGIVVEP